MKKFVILICVSLISLSCTSEDNPIINNGEIRIVFPQRYSSNDLIYDTAWTWKSLTPSQGWLTNFDISKYPNATSLKINCTILINSYSLLLNSPIDTVVFKGGSSYIDFFNVTDSTRIEGSLVNVDSTKIKLNSQNLIPTETQTLHYITDNIISSFPNKSISIGHRKVYGNERILLEVLWAELVIE